MSRLIEVAFADKFIMKCIIVITLLTVEITDMNSLPEIQRSTMRQRKYNIQCCCKQTNLNLISKVTYRIIKHNTL